MRGRGRLRQLWTASFCRCSMNVCCCGVRRTQEGVGEGEGGEEGEEEEEEEEEEDGRT